METESLEQSPLLAAHNCLYRLSSRFESSKSVAIDRLFQSTEALRSRKEMAHIDMERALVEALQRKWQDAAHLDELRTSAMIAMGVLRLALDNMRDDPVGRNLDHHLPQIYKALDDVLRSGGIIPADFLP
jgi:hypothetical protein